MPFMNARKVFAFFLVLLCLGLVPYSVSASALVAAGQAILARERPEAHYVLPSQRGAVQALVSHREPLPSSAGGSIVAILPSLSGLPLAGRNGSASWIASGAGPSTEPEHQRARSPPLS